VYRVFVVKSRRYDLLKYARITLSVTHKGVCAGNDSGTAKLGKLRLDVTIVDIGDLSLDDVAEGEVRSHKNATERNRALHLIVDKLFRLFAEHFVPLHVDEVAFKLLLSIQVIEGDFNGLSVCDVLSVDVERIAREVVDAFAGVALAVLNAVSAGSRRASCGVLLGALAVEIDIARAAVPAGSNGCALVVDGDGAEVLNLDTAEV